MKPHAFIAMPAGSKPAADGRLKPGRGPPTLYPLYRPPVTSISAPVV